MQVSAVHVNGALSSVGGWQRGRQGSQDQNIAVWATWGCSDTQDDFEVDSSKAGEIPLAPEWMHLYEQLGLSIIIINHLIVLICMLKFKILRLSKKLFQNSILFTTLYNSVLK